MNTMTNYVLARYIEDIAVGDTEAVFPGSHEGLLEAVKEQHVKKEEFIVKKDLKIFKVTVEEV